MAQQGSFKSPSRMVPLGGGASSSGAVIGSKSREQGLGGIDFERRNFLGKIVGGIGAAVAVSTLYPVIKYIIPPTITSKSVNELVVGKASEVPEKSGKIFQFNKDKVIVVNDNGKLTACSAVCTHLGCLVHWDNDKNILSCPCHGARYKQTGEIISGPQPLPLPVFKAKIVGEDLIIAKA